MEDLLRRYSTYKGTKLDRSVIGYRNAGCPSLEDCLGKRSMVTTLPLQPKYIDHCLTDVLVDLAMGTPEEVPMKKAREILEELAAYDQVPATDLRKSSCTLTKEQTQYMIDVGMWTKLTAEEVAEIRGIVKIFTRDELWKTIRTVRLPRQAAVLAGCCATHARPPLC